MICRSSQLPAGFVRPPRKTASRDCSARSARWKSVSTRHQPSKSGRPPVRCLPPIPTPTTPGITSRPSAATASWRFISTGRWRAARRSRRRISASRNTILTSAAAAFLTPAGIISKDRLTKSPSGTARWRRTKSPRCWPPMPTRSATRITSIPTCCRKCMA